MHSRMIRFLITGLFSAALTLGHGILPQHASAQGELIGLVGQFDTTGRLTTSVFVVGDDTYLVTANPGNLFAIDVSNPAVLIPAGAKERIIQKGILIEGEGDTITIESISPNSGLTDSALTEFNVLVSYTLTSTDSGELDIGFNNGDDINTFYHVSGATHLVEGVSGEWEFNVSAMTKDWGDAGDFSVLVILSEYPHEQTWTPLAFDLEVLTFAQISFDITDFTVLPVFAVPGVDSVIVTAAVIGPTSLTLSVEIESPDETALDTLPLFDDGAHNDGEVGDSLFGNAWAVPPDEERIYFVDLHISYVDTDTVSFELNNRGLFTTIGPIKYDSHEIVFNNGSILFFDLNLINLGLSSTASNISAEISTADSCVTDINSELRTFGDIAAGATVKSSSTYSIDINQNCAGDALLTFGVALLSDGIEFWNDNFGIQLEPIGVNDGLTGLPSEYALSEAYPNPFNPTTTIEYTLPQSGDVSLIVYNLLGQEVVPLVSGKLDAGYHKIMWEASNMASGIYFYRLQAGEFVQTRKMVLLK